MSTRDKKNGRYFVKIQYQGKHIEFLGSVSNDDAKRLLTAVVAIVNPSTNQVAHPELITEGSVTQTEEMARLQAENKRLKAVIALAADRVSGIEHEGDAIEEAALITEQYLGWIPGDSCQHCGGLVRDDGWCEDCQAPLTPLPKSYMSTLRRVSK